MPENIKCPECGSETVLRTAQKGPNAGQSFHVCNRYPECKGKVPIREEEDADGPLVGREENKIISTEYDKGAVAKPAETTTYEGPPSRRAVEFAKQHRTQLVGGLDEESKSRLAQIISDGIQNKRGIPGISRDIRKEFPDISKTMADTIAQTETNNALSQAFLDRAKDMGITGKEWITADDPCEICAENAAAGAIPIDKAFPSSDVRPPAHENCRCALAPAMLKRKD